MRIHWKRYSSPTPARGFSLVEVLVGSVIFIVVSLAVYQTYSKLFDLVSSSRYSYNATALANEQFEIARNLPYASVGTQGGIPAGVIPPSQVLVRSGVSYTVTTTVRNVDDGYDGTIGGVPNDLSPADYKLMEVTITCDTCRNFNPPTLTARVSPKNLETASTNGALFVKVFNASGQPFAGANVHVVNTSVNPAVDITDTTGTNGMLQLVDVPPAGTSYEITVSKNGYSSDRTYDSADMGGATPVNSHATVALQTLTQASFFIDQTGILNIMTRRLTCAPVGSVPFRLASSKLIGTSPDISKRVTIDTTDAQGNRGYNDVEWDNAYQASTTDPNYDLVGSIPLQPFSFAPGATQDVTLVVEPVNAVGLLITITDDAAQPLSDASVVVGNGLSTTTYTTGVGERSQTDWSGGDGVATSTDNSNTFFASDGNIDTNSPAGVLKLAQVLGNYQANGSLESSSFDTGSTNTYRTISWLPVSQPPGAGADSVRLQIASNNDGGVWDYKGPDGTAATYYTTPGETIHPIHNGNQYLRYKVFLSTTDPAQTPSVSDVSFSFTSACTPPGQVFAGGLSLGTHYIEVTKTGYQDTLQTLDLEQSWQSVSLAISPL